MTLLASYLHLHLLNRAVLVHLNQPLFIPTLQIVPNVDKALFNHVELLGALPIVDIALGSVFLLYACNFLLVLIEQLLRLGKQLSACLAHVLVLLLRLDHLQLLLNDLGLFVQTYIREVHHFLLQVQRH